MVAAVMLTMVMMSVVVMMMSGAIVTMVMMSVVMMSLFVLMTRVVMMAPTTTMAAMTTTPSFSARKWCRGVSWRDAALASETRQRQRSARGSGDAAWEAGPRGERQA